MYILWNDLYYLFLKDFIYLFLEREEGREKERERNINVCLPLTWPLLGTWPTTQTSSLTGNQTSNPLVHSLHSIHWATPARALFVEKTIHFTLNFLACLSKINWPQVYGFVSRFPILFHWSKYLLMPVPHSLD